MTTHSVPVIAVIPSDTHVDAHAGSPNEGRMPASDRAGEPDTDEVHYCRMAQRGPAGDDPR